MQALPMEIRSAADRAVSMSQSRLHGGLDYTLSSAAIVEDMLDEAHMQMAGFSPDQIDAMVKDMGCYLLESARCAFGGKYRWLEATSQPVLVLGEPAYHVTLATWDTVRGRLMGDRGDHIPFHMTAFFARARKACAGDRALYVHR
jgi:hypothetical protein